MADQKITGLPVAAVLNDGDIFTTVQGGANKQMSATVASTKFTSDAQTSFDSRYIKLDGSSPLTANWDAGSFKITAETFASDVVTGTSPFTVASTTLVTNLNADLLDGVDASGFLVSAGTTPLTANWDAGSFKITAETFASDVITGTAPFTVASTTLVTNLNAHALSGKSVGEFILADGTNPLTANWDAGPWKITAETFASDVITGTAPFTVASQTKVINLNADQLDGFEASEFLQASGLQPMLGNWDAGNIKITASTFESDVITGTAPFTVASTTLVTNLNADLLDGNDSSAFALASNVVLRDGTNALTANWDAGSFKITAETFASDIVTGTAPFTVASTTNVTNLNADLLDGLHSSSFLTTDGVTPLTGDWSTGNFNLLHGTTPTVAPSSKSIMTSNSVPRYILDCTTAALNEKMWDFSIEAGVLTCGTLNDAGTVRTDAWDITRTAGTPTLMTVYSSLTASNTTGSAEVTAAYYSFNTTAAGLGDDIKTAEADPYLYKGIAGGTGSFVTGDLILGSATTTASSTRIMQSPNHATNPAQELATFGPAWDTTIHHNNAGQIILGECTCAFTDPSVVIAGTIGRLFFEESSAALNEKVWDLLASGSEFKIRAVDDTSSTATTAMQIIRSGATVTSVAFGAPTTTTTSASLSAASVILNNAVVNPSGLLIDFTAAAPNNSTDYFLQCSDTSGTRVRIDSNGGIVLSAATGGNQGVGTLNAQGVYDDGVLLTCYPIEAYLDGDIDLAKWDEIAEGEHKKAASFKAERMDMVDVDKFIGYWVQNRHLPSFPGFEDWSKLSLGDLAQRLWETVDLYAVHIKQLNDKIEMLKK